MGFPRYKYVTVECGRSRRAHVVLSVVFPLFTMQFCQYQIAGGQAFSQIAFRFRFYPVQDRHVTQSSRIGSDHPVDEPIHLEFANPSAICPIYSLQDLRESEKERLVQLTPHGFHVPIGSCLIQFRMFLNCIQGNVRVSSLSAVTLT